MKKVFISFLFCVIAAGALTISSCNKEENIDPDTNDTNVVDTTLPVDPDDPDDPDEPEFASIIGEWLMVSSRQYSQDDPDHFVDMTPFYAGWHFIFDEGGTLTIDNGISTSAMDYTFDGNILTFIQPGNNPVPYTVHELSETTLIMADERDPNYITSMTLSRW